MVFCSYFKIVRDHALSYHYFHRTSMQKVNVASKVSMLMNIVPSLMSAYKHSDIIQVTVWHQDTYLFPPSLLSEPLDTNL
jgi:hypothetical protein